MAERELTPEEQAKKAELETRHKVPVYFIESNGIVTFAREPSMAAIEAFSDNVGKAQLRAAIDLFRSCIVGLKDGETINEHFAKKPGAIVPAANEFLTLAGLNVEATVGK